MEILGGTLLRNETNTSAMGGTEIIATHMATNINQDLLKEFQIVHSRVRNIDESKIRIFVAHDLPKDPESEFFRNGGHNKFHKLVFVSNWQMQQYISEYNIPWSKCVVLRNAITSIDEHVKPTDKIRLAYWSTPHRGLNILIPVFQKLCEKYDNIELDVYSSFKLYGWEQRDDSFKELFDVCKNDPKINYHGTVSNDVIRENLKQTHILAYPSTWPETSCMVLMEAMSAGLLCVHSNYAALYETAANWTHMYQYHEDPSLHAGRFYQVLDSAIANYWDPGIQSGLKSQKSYADIFYNWKLRTVEWEALLESMLDEPRAMTPSGTNFFQYNA
jgi:glycosyltransferase involved in cell wall biosynthesis